MEAIFVRLSQLSACFFVNLQPHCYNTDQNMTDNKGEIIMYQPDETIRLEVRMGEETVWLTQQQMAELFDKDRTVIGRHIRNIYKEEELERDITCAKFAHMGSDGDQEYEYTAYNLDVIISVGYRVKSKRGTKFRQWADIRLCILSEGTL